MRHPVLIYLPSPWTCPFETTQQPPLTHTSSVRLPLTEALFVTGSGSAVLRPCPCPPGAPRLLRETGLDDCPSTWGRAQRGGDDALLGVAFLSRDLSLPSHRAGLMVYTASLLCARAGLGSQGGDGCGGPCHQGLQPSGRWGMAMTALCGLLWGRLVEEGSALNR